MTFTELFDPKSTIAILALFVALWSITSSRKHNKLTVRPHLYELIEIDSVNFICGFYITNKGLGPALIKSTTYYLDGVAVEFKELLNVIEKLPSEFGIYITKLKPGSAISKDEKCSIIEIKWDGLKYELPANKETRKRIKDDIKGFSSQLSKRLGVVVEWESSYGEKGKIQSHPSEA
jgi:hypothetical protein